MRERGVQGSKTKIARRHYRRGPGTRTGQWPTVGGLGTRGFQARAPGVAPGGWRVEAWHPGVQGPGGGWRWADGRAPRVDVPGTWGIAWEERGRAAGAGRLGTRGVQGPCSLRGCMPGYPGSSRPGTRGVQGIFLTQESKPCLLCLLHCRQILYPLNHLGSPCKGMSTS